MPLGLLVLLYIIWDLGGGAFIFKYRFKKKRSLYNIKYIVIFIYLCFVCGKYWLHYIKETTKFLYTTYVDKQAHTVRIEIDK